MGTCYALSASLDLSSLEIKQYRVRTTTSGLPTSPSAFVSTVSATVCYELINSFGNVLPVLVRCSNNRVYQDDYAKFKEVFIFILSFKQHHRKIQMCISFMLKYFSPL